MKSIETLIQELTSPLESRGWIKAPMYPENEGDERVVFKKFPLSFYIHDSWPRGKAKVSAHSWPKYTDINGKVQTRQPREYPSIQLNPDKDISKIINDILNRFLPEYIKAYDREASTVDTIQVSVNRQLESYDKILKMTGLPDFKYEADRDGKLRSRFSKYNTSLAALGFIPGIEDVEFSVWYSGSVDVSISCTPQIAIMVINLIKEMKESQ